MRIAMFAAVAALALSAAAEMTPERLAELKRAQYRENGGWVVKEDPGNGFIAIVNLQKRVDEKSGLLPVMRYFKKFTRLAVRVLGEKDRRGTLSVEVVDDGRTRRALSVYPEERVAVVNVAALAADDPTADCLALRTRKEVSRAIAWLCGAAGSQYPGTLAGYIGSPKSLDRFEDEGLPPDVFMRMSIYATQVGIRPVVRTTYRNACAEGWAPQPTNDIQKAIWNDVHAPPSKPMKITYDKAAKKPVVK